LTSENGAGEFREFVDHETIHDLEMFQLRCWFCELCQCILEVRGEGDRLQPTETMGVAKCDGEEELHLIWRLEQLINVEELFPRSGKESFDLFRLGGGEVEPRPDVWGGEVNLCPEVWDGE